MSTDAGGPLTEAEWRLWFAWKRAHEVVRARTTEDVRAATGVSDADTAVLVHLADTGVGVRQHQLAARLGWERSRTSHQVSRMAERGLLRREKVGDGVVVHLTAEGQQLIDTATPVHAAAVRRQLVQPFTTAQLAQLQEALEQIAGPSPS